MSDPWAEFQSVPAAKDPWAEFAPVPPPSMASRAADIVSGVTGGIVEGIPIAGPYIRAGADRAAALARSVTGGKPYAEELAGLEARGRQFKEEHPYADTGAQIAGGVLGTIPAVVAAPTAFGAGSGGLLARSALSGLTGAGIGGADTAVRTGGDTAESAKGAGVGALFGLVSPGAGQLVGRGVGALGDAIAARRAPVPGLGNPATTMLAEDFRNAGGVPAVRDRLAELGAEGMLLDASPSLTGRAQGLATLPDTREAVVAPLIRRQGGANARLTGDLDGAIGPALDPAAFTAAADRAYETTVRPLYARALAEPVQVDTAPVFTRIQQLAAEEKGGANTALGRAWQLIHTEGEVPGIGRAAIPDRRPGALHNVKEELDAMYARAEGKAGSAARSELRAIAETRRVLNEALEGQVPGYADANRAGRDLFQQRDAFTRGQTLLNGGREAARPAQVAAETAAMTPELQQAQRLGLRAEVDRIVGTQLNDRVALQKAIQGEGDWNRARLATVFGEDPTQRIVGAVERESTFDRSYTDIVRNSMTELRKRAADATAPRDIKPSGDNGFSLAGLIGGVKRAVGAASVKVGKAGVNAVGRASDIARNKQLAEVLAQGASSERDVLLDAMANRLAAQGRGAAAASRVDALVRALLQSQGERGRAALPVR